MIEVIGKRALEAAEDTEIRRKLRLAPKVTTNKDIVIFFDGSCWPNPGGKMGVGVVVYKAVNFKIENPNSRSPKSSYTSLKIKKKISYSIDQNEGNTNNVAEHSALNEALLYLYRKKINGRRVFVFGDSQITIRQINGDYAINPGKKYYSKAKENNELLKEMNKANVFKFIWIPRELNVIADSLSKI